MNTVFLGNGVHAYTKIMVKSCKKYFYQSTVFFIQKPIVRFICQIKGLFLKICYRPHFFIQNTYCECGQNILGGFDSRAGHVMDKHAEAISWIPDYFGTPKWIYSTKTQYQFFC